MVHETVIKYFTYQLHNYWPFIVHNNINFSHNEDGMFCTLVSVDMLKEGLLLLPLLQRPLCNIPSCTVHADRIATKAYVWPLSVTIA